MKYLTRILNVCFEAITTFLKAPARALVSVRIAVCGLFVPLRPAMDMIDHRKSDRSPAYQLLGILLRKPRHNFEVEIIHGIRKT